MLEITNRRKTRYIYLDKGKLITEEIKTQTEEQYKDG